MRFPKAGFTIIELLIVVTILGILTAIAFPLYQDYVQNARRSEGKSMLTEVMQRQERFFTKNNQYTTDLKSLNYNQDPASSEKGWYQVSASGKCSGGLTQCVRLEAVPQKSQKMDDCGTLVMTSRGTKDVTNATASVDECW